MKRMLEENVWVKVNVMRENIGLNQHLMNAIMKLRAKWVKMNLLAGIFKGVL